MSPLLALAAFSAFPALVACDSAAIAVVESSWIATAATGCAQLAAALSSANITGVNAAATGIEIAGSCFLPTDIAHVGAMRALDGLVLEPDRGVRVAPVESGHAGVEGELVTYAPHSLRLLQSDPVLDTAAQPRAWGLDRIDQTRLPLDGFAFSPGGAGVGATVYIIDTGVYAAHTDFGGRAHMSADFIDEIPRGDNHGHGTHTSGTAIGATLGVARRAQVKAVKVLDRRGSGSITGVIRGIEWAVSDARRTKRPGVLSLSLGGALSPALNRAVLAAGSAGNIVVAAAGNSATDACYFSPASAGGNALRTGIVTVMASTTTDSLAFFSNWGRCTDIAAPGMNILSASNSGRTATRLMSGTSMSAPYVSGVAAILMQTNNFNRSAAIRQLLSLARNGSLTGLPAMSPNLLLQTPAARASGHTSGAPSSAPSSASSSSAPSSAPSIAPSSAPSDSEGEPDPSSSSEPALAGAMMVIAVIMMF